MGVSYPKELPGEAVQCESSRALGENSIIKCNVSLENKRICHFLCLGWLTKMNSSCDISCPVQVLRTRIAQVDCIGVDLWTVPALWFVVDDRGTAIWSDMNQRRAPGTSSTAYLAPVEDMVSNDNPT